MTAGVHGRSGRGHFVLALLIASLWLKLLVPAGYMLLPSGTGLPTVTPCDGMAVQSVDSGMAMHGQKGERHHESRGHESPCPYAALSAPAAPPQPPLLVPVVLPPDLAPPIVGRESRDPPALSAPPPPSTGPPAFA